MDDFISITLSLEDGTEMDCHVISVFSVFDKEYIAVLPAKIESEDEEEQILLFRYQNIGEDEIEIQNIEDDDEWERAVDKFDELMAEK